MTIATDSLGTLSQLFGEYDELIADVQGREVDSNWLNDDQPCFGVNADLDEADSRYVISSFAVGDLVTEHFYTDAHAGRIVEVRRGGKEVVMQEDTATLDPEFKPEFIEGGFAGHCVNQGEQRYTYTANPRGSISTFTLRTWRGIRVWTRKSNTPGCSNAPNGLNQISHGQRKFYDYNF
jgi:hypothetical protein